MQEWINYLKEKIGRGKEDAFVWYSIASRWFTLGNILLYVAACIIAGGLVGPVRYVEFLYNCCHFGQAAQVAQAAVTVPKLYAGDEIIPIIPAPAGIAKRHKPAPKPDPPESSF
jgi:hypothetical protein